MLFFSGDIDKLGLTAEKFFRYIITVYQYLLSKAETRRICFIMNFKDASFRELKMFGHLLVKFPAGGLFNVRRRFILIINRLKIKIIKFIFKN